MQPSDLLPSVPDLPRRVETRGLLLSGKCAIYADTKTDFVLRSHLEPLVCVVGKPAQTLLATAISEAPAEMEILAARESLAHLQTCLPDWRRQPVVIHELPKSDLTRQDDFSNVRFCNRHEIQALPVSATDLRNELLRLPESAEIAASFVNNQPVSFCYAAHQTETLWDVSIETLPDFRHRGLAEKCFRFLLHHQFRRNLRPVWGAEADNLASLKLADKLGFVAVDDLFLFFRPGS